LNQPIEIVDPNIEHLKNGGELFGIPGGDEPKVSEIIEESVPLSQNEEKT
jgi:hypothetical protein